MTSFHDNILHISIPMMWCAKRQGVPVRILHSHSSKLGETRKKELRNRAFCPILRSLATDYLACSKIAGQMMFGNRKFTVLPNVIRAEKYRFDSAARENVRRKMNTQDRFVIGSVGRLAIQKNPFFAMVSLNACRNKSQTQNIGGSVVGRWRNRFRTM